MGAVRPLHACTDEISSLASVIPRTWRLLTLCSKYPDICSKSDTHRLVLLATCLTGEETVSCCPTFRQQESKPLYVRQWRALGGPIRAKAVSAHQFVLWASNIGGGEAIEPRKSEREITVARMREDTRSPCGYLRKVPRMRPLRN